MIVTCRARVSKHCDDGKELYATEFRQYGANPADEEPMYLAYQQDSTYQASDDSIVCTACFIEIGQPSVRAKDRHRRLDIINQAIEEYKSKHGF